LRSPFLNSPASGEAILKSKKPSEKLFIPVKIIFFRTFIFMLLLIWCIGFIPGIFLKLSENLIVLLPVLKKIYAGVCYQDPEKTFTLFGMQLLVCTRCTGIYLGAAALSIISVFYKKIRCDKNYLLLGLAAIITDKVLYNSGVFYYSRYFSFATGFFFGSAAFIYILIILENEFFIKE
jgi:uncharacterized membrane protein